MTDYVSSPRLLGIIVALAFARLPNVAGAAEYDDLPKGFLELVAKGDMGAAIDYLGGNGVQMDPDTVSELRRKVVKNLTVYGSYAYHEKLREEKVGTRFAKLTYIVGYEHHPLELSLILYRPKDKWLFGNFNILGVNEGGLRSFFSN